jgi:hypothetical protein
MVLALAGRRVDAAGVASPRFPPERVEAVRAEVHTMLQRLHVSALVSSAACGADLIALVEAGRLGLRRRVVLPAAVARFRDTSVTDRGAAWGPVYDDVLADVARRNDLVVLAGAGDGDAAYAAANQRILDEAIALGRERGEKVAAALVWDGAARGAGDVTEAFGAAARARKLNVVEILTL